MKDTGTIDSSEAPPPTLTLPIEPPIMFQGGKHEALVLKEPTVGQKHTAQEQLRNGANAPSICLYEQHLISLVAGKPIEVIRQLPVSTFNQAMAYVDYFLDAGRRTGWT